MSFKYKNCCHDAYINVIYSTEMAYINIFNCCVQLVCHMIFENKYFVVSCRALHAVKSTQLRCFSSQYELPLFGSGIHLLFSCGFATSDFWTCGCFCVFTTSQVLVSVVLNIFPLKLFTGIIIYHLKSITIIGLRDENM